MKKAILFCSMIGLLTAFSLTGCSGEGSNPAGTVPEVTEEAEETTEDEAETEQGEETAEEPEVTVEVTEEPEVLNPEEVTEESKEETEQEQPEAADGLDFEELYQQGMNSFTEAGVEAPILFPETDIAYLENFYPGISYANIKQIYAAMAPVPNAPSEIVMVEVADGTDVAAIRDILHERIIERANDEMLPEEAAAWEKNGIVTIQDNYIFMAVLPNGYEIPEEFILEHNPFK